MANVSMCSARVVSRRLANWNRPQPTPLGHGSPERSPAAHVASFASLAAAPLALQEPASRMEVTLALNY
eukprot:6210509-Pleurochrysis_carterae.AAC.2